MPLLRRSSLSAQWLGRVSKPAGNPICRAHFFTKKSARLGANGAASPGAFHGSSPTANLASGSWKGTARFCPRENGASARLLPFFNTEGKPCHRFAGGGRICSLKNQMIATGTKRPRNVDWTRAAAILYGDWGTSKAYVVGLAFAVAGYSSFWLIAAMCLLTALVGINYMAICAHYPDGGGVYASVRHRSEVISIVGAFLLIADYIVTAALSALSAFQYLQFSHPEIWAAVSHRGHRRAELFRAETYRRPGVCHRGADGARGGFARGVLRAAPRRGDPPFAAAAREHVDKLDWLRRHRARALGRRGDCQLDRRDEARSGQHGRAAERAENFHESAAS